MTHQVKRSPLRSRPHGIALVLAAGGAVLGAVIVSRRAGREALHPPSEPDQRASDIRPELQQHDVPPVSRTETRTGTRPRLRRRAVGMAYGIALMLVLSGVGVLGVAVASQRQIPQAPTAPTGFASPAPETAAPAADVTTRSDDGLRARAQMAATAPSPQQRITEEASPPTLPRSRPVALDIPSIDVHSVVRRLGLTEEGELETPSGRHYNDAAWYRHSPTPGSLGPSILLGHVDSATDGPSVFFRLGELRAGDRIKVTRADGSVAVFNVDDVRRFPKKDFPTERVYGDIDHAGLRILTCGGPFNEVSGHYTDDVVVFASLVDE